MIYTPWRLRRFARTFAEGGLFVYPTETVFGLGCNPADRVAVARLLALKGRDVSKGLILIASDRSQLAPWVVLTDRVRECLSRPSERPTTWLVPATAETPRWIRGEHAAVAVRLSRFPEVVSLCETVGSALISTSANLSGWPTPRQPYTLRRQFQGRVEMVLPGLPGSRGLPSQILACDDGRVVRD